MGPSLLALLKSLNDHSVRYVIIGAVAFPPHGYVRNTGDVDILFEPTVENATRLRRALSASGYPVEEATMEEFLSKKTLFRGFLPEVDTHPSAKGVTWEGVWVRHKSAEVRGIVFPVASLEDLIAMKRAAGRPQDLVDLEKLEAILRRRSAPDGDP